MRRWRPTRAQWRRIGLIWVTSFAFLAGLVSAVFAFLPGDQKLTAARSLTMIVGIGLVSGAAAWFRVRPAHLPLAIGPVPTAPDRLPRLVRNCDAALVRQANELASEHYGKESINWRRYREWHQRNPDILVCLVGPTNDVLGYFDVLPLRAATLQALIEGTLKEKRIRPEDLLDPAMAAGSDSLYIAGIAVRDPESYIDQKHASILIWGLLKYLECFYPPSQRRCILALASTPEGEHLLREFGFVIKTPKSMRRDGHNLYEFCLTPESLTSTVLSIPNMQRFVQIEWALPASDAVPA